jgi:hypothetical protein
VAGVVSGLLVAGVLVSGQVLASADSPLPGRAPASAGATQSAEPGDCDQNGSVCGNDHSAAVQAWVRCKADNGKDACPKPTPPGKALGHTKHFGSAPGSARTHGRGFGWGRAHAHGQLKAKAKHPDELEDDADHD